MNKQETGAINNLESQLDALLIRMNDPSCGIDEFKILEKEFDQISERLGLLEQK